MTIVNFLHPFLQTETQICISAMAFRSTAKCPPVNPVQLPDPEASPEDLLPEDAGKAPAETEPENPLGEFPMPENPDDALSGEEKEGAEVGNYQGGPEEQPAQIDAGLVLSQGVGLLPRMPSDFFEAGAVPVEDDDDEAWEDPADWTEETAYDCNKQVKKHVTQDGQVIHCTSLAFDLDCSKGQARPIDTSLYSDVAVKRRKYLVW